MDHDLDDETPRRQPNWKVVIVWLMVIGLVLSMAVGLLGGPV